jgi:hypothetical protein
MSAQGGSKGGQQQGYGQQGYMDPNLMNGQRGMQSMMPGFGGDYGGGYFSLGNSRRMSMGNGAGSSNPFLVGPGTQSPFARGPATGNTSGPTSMPNPFSGPLNMPADFGPPPPNAGGPQYQPAASMNNDPNSPEYAAQYWGYAPSTRAYMQAPGSAGANTSYQSWLAGQRDPTQAHF